MENGRNGSHTNHDRDQRPNGINGANHVPEKNQEKGKGKAEPQQNMTPISPTISNGLNGNFMDGQRHQNGGTDAVSENLQERLNQLPPEIVHITQGYMPLSKLLSRLAQKTHSDLSSTILELAQMPIPASALNGNSSHVTTVDDNSPENLAKKLRMLKFAQDAHTEWTKALVITGWSRRAEDVSRTIDLKIHLDNQMGFYDSAFSELAEVKERAHTRAPTESRFTDCFGGPDNWKSVVDAGCMFLLTLFGIILTITAGLHSATSADCEGNLEISGKSKHSSYYTTEFTRLQQHSLAIQRLRNKVRSRDF